MLADLQPLVDTAVQYASNHPEQAAGAVGGLAATLFNYQKTGKFPIGRLPFRALRNAWREYSDRYFGTSRPKGSPALRVTGAGQDAIEAALRNRHYEDSDLMSYEYEDEVLNMRRPERTRPDPQSGEPIAMETHTRTFDTQSGDVLVLTHHEPNRLEETTEHLAEDLFSWSRGRDIVMDDLREQGIDFEQIESERAAGIDVTPN